MKKYSLIVYLIMSVATGKAQTSVVEGVSRLYNADNFVNEEVKTQSTGASSTRYVYPRDITPAFSGCSLSGEALGLKNLADKNILSAPVEVYHSNSSGIGVGVVTGAELYVYNTSTPYPKELWKLETQVPLTSFAPYHASGCSVVKDPKYKLEEEYLSYDDYGNLLEKRIKGNKKISYVYGYKGLYQIATVENAGNNEIAYSSFEMPGEHGFWTYNDVGVVVGSGLANTKAYNLAVGGNMDRSVPLGTYIVSYWSFNLGSVAGGSPGSTVNGGYTSTSGWIYVEFEVANTTQIYISGSAVIDEVRVFPKSSLMQTAAYKPLVGMVYSSDVSNRYSTYEYDDLGRLLAVRDKDGNITKKMEYGIQQPE